jgi:hypothetical protein
LNFLANGPAPYPRFAPHLQPYAVKFTSMLPQFPESHIKGIATVIGPLDDSVLNPEAITKLKDGIQYSLTRGHGNRLRDNVEFFATEDEDVPMIYSQRQCAGVKVCEFLADEMKTPHTSVEVDGNMWARGLAEQTFIEADSSATQVEVLYERYKDEICDRPRYLSSFGFLIAKMQYFGRKKSLWRRDCYPIVCTR